MATTSTEGTQQQQQLNSPTTQNNNNDKHATHWDRIDETDNGPAYKAWLLNRATVDEYNEADLLVRSSLRSQFDREQQQQQPANDDDPAAPDPKRVRLSEFPFPEVTTEKKCLERGDLANIFGGLVDREDSKEHFYTGLVELAGRVGNKGLDKKQSPMIGLTATSGGGKTEFLRWIFNSCCTYVPEGERKPDNAATTLLPRLNEAIPEGQTKLNRILVLFASFNQTSTYFNEEGPIEQTTVERLLRSFQGSVTMQGDSSWKKQRFKDFHCFEDIMNFFRKTDTETGQTGFIFCLDEVSNLRKTNRKVYTSLMDRIMGASQGWIAEGGFCAVAAAAISLYDIGEAVLQLSARATLPVHFPKRNPTMVEKASKYVRENTDVFKGSTASKDREEFLLRTSTSVVASSARVESWRTILDLPKTTTRVNPPEIPYQMPEDLTYTDIFLIVAQSLFRKKQKWSTLTREKMTAVLDDLHGSLYLKPFNEGETKATRLAQLTEGQFMLDPWRLLQFSITKDCMFKWVENWVVVETRKLFYTYVPSETEKMWEVATMGVLELRRGFLMACSEAEHPVNTNSANSPTLRDIVENLGVHHNVCNELMIAASTKHPTKLQLTRNLKQDIKATYGNPHFLYSSVQNEEGIEGVLKGVFKKAKHEEVYVFIQMKMYRLATAMQVLTWLEHANDRAKSLNLKAGSYVVQLFVTGAIEGNIEDHKNRWPKNCMVFGTEALTGLFRPFGTGIIDDLIKLKSRPGNDRAIIKEGTDLLQHKYPKLFSNSPNCRPPHLNVTNLRNLLVGSDAVKLLNLKTGEDLVNWMLERNKGLEKKYSSVNPTKPAAKAAVEKARKHNLYLGMETSWL